MSRSVASPLDDYAYGDLYVSRADLLSTVSMCVCKYVCLCVLVCVCVCALNQTLSV